MKRFALLALLTLIASPALAQEPGAERMPQGVSERGMVLDRGVLRGDFAPRDFGLLFGGIGNPDMPGFRVGRYNERTVLTLGLGAAMGVVDNLEVGAMLLPIYLAPNGDFGDIEAYGRYRFLEGDVELGAQVTVALPTHTDFGIGLGVPALFHLGQLRIDTGLELELIFSDPTVVNLEIPAGLSVDIGDGFFAGGRTGISLPNLDHFAMPLHGFVGYTLISGRAPFIDLVATFGWPTFIWSGPGDKVIIENFELIFGARFFFSVM